MSTGLQSGATVHYHQKERNQMFDKPTMTTTQEMGPCPACGQPLTARVEMSVDIGEEAPESVVRALDDEVRCKLPTTRTFVDEHGEIWPWGETIREAADAVWAAAYPEALRDAAERLDEVKPYVCPCDHPEACCGSEEACDAMQPSVRVIGASDLRRWADESEANRA